MGHTFMVTFMMFSYGNVIITKLVDTNFTILLYCIFMLSNCNCISECNFFFQLKEENVLG